MELKGKRINILGDSITEGVGASDTEHCYVSKVEEFSGALVRNYGISGTRIARRREPTEGAPQFDYCYLDRVEPMEDADIIVVFGGTNDFGHGDAPLGELGDTDEYIFYGAMESLCQRLMKKYPAAEIVFMTPLHRTSENNIINEKGLPTAKLSEYCEAIRVVCDKYSIPVLDLWKVGGIQPSIKENMELLLPDGLHPSDAGHEKIARKLVAFLKTL